MSHLLDLNIIEPQAPSPSYGGGHRPSSGGKNPLGGGGGGLTDSPLLLLLIPLVLLLVGVPIVAAFRYTYTKFSTFLMI